MLTCIKTILGKDLQLNPYEEYFTVKPNPSEQDSLNKLNRLLSLALPYQFRAGARCPGIGQRSRRR